jgi:hypothetical protein
MSVSTTAIESCGFEGWHQRRPHLATDVLPPIRPTDPAKRQLVGRLADRRDDLCPVVLHDRTDLEELRPARLPGHPLARPTGEQLQGARERGATRVL